MSKIPGRSQPDNAPATWTPAAFQEEGLVEAIENGGDIPVPPDGMGAALRTPFDPGPWIGAPLLGKLLENYGDKEYHGIILVGIN
jgi:hypothetical protein